MNPPLLTLWVRVSAAPDARGSPAWWPSRSSLQRGNPGHCGAELYPSEPCEKCPFESCWRTTLITLHYLLTFRGMRGAPLPVGSAPTTPSLPWMGEAVPKPALYLLPIHPWGPGDIGSEQKPCQVEERTAIPVCLGLHLSVCPSRLFLVVTARHMELRDHEWVFPVSQPPFLPKKMAG